MEIDRVHAVWNPHDALRRKTVLMQLPFHLAAYRDNSICLVQDSERLFEGFKLGKSVEVAILPRASDLYDAFFPEAAGQNSCDHCVPEGHVNMEHIISPAILEQIAKGFAIAVLHPVRQPMRRPVDPHAFQCLLQRRIGKSGILGVHVWGRPCAIDELSMIAQKHGLRLLFDAAHAFGCSHRGRMVGNFGEAEVFSFHATKFFNTFEGGAVATNNDELAAKIRLMTNFGFSGYDNVIYLGTNGKMSEVSAAMGLSGLESLDTFIACNHRNYQKYRQELADVPGVSLIRFDEAEENNLQYIVVEIDESVTHMSRDHFLNILHRENVLARRYFYPGCHKMEPYRSFFPHAGLLLPETERLTQRVLSLPTGTAVKEQDIEAICQIIRLLAQNGAEVSGRMGRYAVAFA